MLRRAELIGRALRLLPPVQNAGIVLGEAVYTAEEVHADLVLHGRVVGPPEEAQAAQAAGVVGRWEAWKSGPLLIHDAAFLAAIHEASVGLDFSPDTTQMICTEAIKRVLNGEPVKKDGEPVKKKDGEPVKKDGGEDEEELQPPVHQGVVQCLRLERCPPADVVGRIWMKRIRAFRGEDGLRELLLFNSERPVEPFPLHGLPAGLRSLALGFFTLPKNPLHASHLTGLSELRLTGCAFSGQWLSTVIQHLHGLTVLELGYSRLTDECGPGGLHLVSTSLLRLHFWACTASGGVSLQYTPKLAVLSAGVLPLDGSGKIHLEMRTPGALRQLHGLKLHRHELTYIGSEKRKLDGRTIAPVLPLLTTLSVCLEMADITQFIDLLDLLRYLPNICELSLQRLDTANNSEDLPGEAPFSIPCIRNSLRALALRDFRGGPAEVGFVKCILLKARRLDSVNIHLHLHPVMTTQVATSLIALINTCPKASPRAQVVLAQ